MVSRPPKQPDPYQTAKADAEINRINQYTPTGNIEFGYTGAGGSFIPNYPTAPQQAPSTFPTSPPNSGQTGVGKGVGGYGFLPGQGGQPQASTFPSTTGGMGGTGPAAVRVTEDPYQTAIRNQMNALGLGVLGKLGPLVESTNPALQGTVGSAQIRGNLPFLQGGGGMNMRASTFPSRGTALPGLVSPDQVRGNLQPLPSTANLGANLPGMRGSGQIEGALPGLPSNGQDAVQSVIDSTFDLGMRKLQPGMDLNRRRSMTDLDVRGLPVGGEAYNSAMGQLSQSENDLRTNLALASVMAGRDEAARQFGQDMQLRGQVYGEQMGLAGLDSTQRGQLFGEQTGVYDRNASNYDRAYGTEMGLAGLASQNRGQMFGENMQQAQFAEQTQQNRLAQALAAQGQAFGQEMGLANLDNQGRTQNFNELVALLSGQQVQAPMAVNVPNIDLSGMIQQNYATKAAGASGNNQAMGGLLGSLAQAGAYAWASDANLKHDVTPQGRLNGHNVYTFRYNNDPSGDLYFGVMAQEVMQTRPDAVMWSDGHLCVDYQKIEVPFEKVHYGTA